MLLTTRHKEVRRTSDITTILRHGRLFVEPLGVVSPSHSEVDGFVEERTRRTLRKVRNPVGSGFKDVVGHRNSLTFV